MSNPVIDELKREFRQGSVLIRLIFINIAVFLAINIAALVFWLLNIPANSGCFEEVFFLTYWISVPADLPQLLMRPWTLITYMFTHEGLMHILFNLLVFYFAGKIFLMYLNEKRLLSTYIFGGLAGALFFILSYNIFPIFNESVDCAICLGASASVMAVMIAIATFVPNLEVSLILFGSVRLKYIAIIYVVVDIISIKSGNAGGHIAHLGGALWGYFYIQQYKRGRDLSFSFNKIVDSISAIFKRSRMRVEHKKPVSDSEYNKDKAKRQKKIDEILDKISKSGYDSLSREEKDFLFKASNNKL